MTDDKVLFRAEGIDKSFGPTYANRKINFSLKKGEVRGLAGENGSGKSTFLSQISGINRSDAGIMFFNDQEYSPKSPVDANHERISIVVQELGLVGNLPAGINVFLGKTSRFSKFGIVSLKKVYEAANEVLKKWDLPQIPFHQSAGDMSVESRKMVEIARALSADPELLMLDEVTQALSHDNRASLYDLLNFPIAKYKSEP